MYEVYMICGGDGYYWSSVVKSGLTLDEAATYCYENSTYEEQLHYREMED